MNHQKWWGNVGLNFQLQGVVNGLVGLKMGYTSKLLVWDLNAEHHDRPDDFGVPYHSVEKNVYTLTELG